MMAKQQKLQLALGALVLASICLLGASLPTILANESGPQNEHYDGMPGHDGKGASKFDQFKVLFHKTYGSIAEEIRRKALFWSSSIVAFVSRTKYNHKQSSSFQTITDMSDWSASEFQQTLMDASSYHKEYAVELDSEGLDSPVSSPETESKFMSIAKSALEKLGKSGESLFDRTDRFVENAFRVIFYRKPAYRPDLPDEVFVDHRKDGCLTEVRRQGQCGSCYIFSTIALYEWAYCKAHDEPVQLSEQYLVDCGHIHGLKGCKGGHEYKVSQFVQKFGFEYLDKYRYLFGQHECPYDAKKTSSKEMGQLRLDKPVLTSVMPQNVEKELLLSPLIIAIYCSDIFQGYGGGIDEGATCNNLKNRKGLHSMLLVGSGRKDGHEYWLIRNSYGTRWGEQGYYRLRKDSNCIAGFSMAQKIKAVDKRVLDGKPTYKYFENPNYDPSVVEESKTKSFYSHLINRNFYS